MTPRTHLPLATILAASLGAPNLAAQQPNQSLEQRVRALEASARSGSGATANSSGQQAPETTRRGIGHLGQTTIFDPTFNPAISVIGDFVYSGTDANDNFESHNQFRVRDVEVGLVGRIDPSLSYQVYVHFSEEDIELEEAYLLADDWLPGTFSLKAGRFNSDFGKLSPIHDHDLPFVDKPQVLQEYLGGALRGTGIELHHNTELGESTLLRWSAGAVNGLDGDTHAVFGPGAGHGHDEEGAEPFGDRDFENLAFTGRVTALTDIGETGTLQIGGSVAWAPEARSFFDTGTSVIAADLETLVAGVDATFKTLDPETGSGFRFGAELLISDNESSDDGMTIAQNESSGFYAYVESIFGPTWSIGASGGVYEHAENDNEDSTDVGAFVTYRRNEFNRLRLEVRHFDDPMEDSIGVMLQWTTILGSHGHGVDW